jgi:RNA polymerase sigma-70 factor, ECF subfamily
MSNQETAAELFEQYHGPIFAYLYRLVNERELAHDLAQETFLQLVRCRDRLPQIENRRAWLYRVATNLAFNALKRKRRWQWLPWQAVDGAGAESGDSADALHRRNAVATALDSLPPHYRAPLLLYSRYDLSVREIAEALSLSETAVKTRLRRSRALFRQAYAEAEEQACAE